MGMSLAFHIVFAVIGMAMPLLMAVSDGCYLWTRKPVFLALSKRWAAGTTILFAVGAVSGMLLEFEIRLHCVTVVQSCAVFFSSRRRHTRSLCDWSSDVCSSD